MRAVSAAMTRRRCTSLCILLIKLAPPLSGSPHGAPTQRESEGRTRVLVSPLHAVPGKHSPDATPRCFWGEGGVRIPQMGYVTPPLAVGERLPTAGREGLGDDPEVLVLHL